VENRWWFTHSVVYTLQHLHLMVTSISRVMVKTTEIKAHVTDHLGVVLMWQD
jgi:hypothetical protein